MLAAMTETLCSAFQRTAAARPDAVALRTPGADVEITWRDYADRVRALAGGLAALGVRHGDTVGLMLTNRPEFAICDTAALHLGATPFSVYNTSAPEQIAHVFGNAGNRIVIAEEQFHETLRAASDDVTILDVETVGDLAGDPAFAFDAAWQAVQPGDVATLIYTSGTTGPPKGVELTHANLLAEVAMTTSVLPVHAEDRSTSYLPSAHVADRWSSHYTQIVCGHQVTFVADPRAIAAALPEVRPTVWGAVPRIWEKLKAGLEAAGIADPSALDDPAKAAVRAKIGLDQARWLCSGAAPVPVQVLEYFMSLGLPICEVWGMSELSCCATINPRDDIRIGTVGPALPGIELMLGEDDELLVRGPTVMKGYRNDPDKTAEALAGGWLHTGDVATIDADGYVRIVDRKKELIINSAGKNMSPANIEQTLKSSSPLIGQAVCIGDARPYNVALLVLDPDVANGRRAGDDDLEAEIAAAIARANAHLARVEQIKRYVVLDAEWQPGGDELTPTMKLRRKPISEKYAAAIEALYAGSPA
jgi:long-subunit acyl-CoA synthetase (AMP-forming)